MSCGWESCGVRKETSIRDLLSLKRDGTALTDQQIHDFVTQVIEKRIQESQIGAMLMAMYIRGLDTSEAVALTRCMFHHGDRMEWDDDVKPLLVDKHSTGGVGDKVSLILAPALAACGLKVPMLSGRGLEFTGGTLDKLESIPGFNTRLTKEEMENAIREAGCFIAGPTNHIAPADGVIYGVRDVTCTVKSLGLIAGSILSKKLAGGASALVLDIKVGRAAFFKTEEEARELAELLVKIANELGLPAVAVLTRMDTPIGRAVGNVLEVIETLETLRGDGPSDLVDLVAELGAELLHLKNIVPDATAGVEAIRNSLQNGSALRSFRAMLQCQGVSEEVATAVCQNDLSYLPHVPEGHITAITAPRSGVVDDVDAMLVAQACLALGAGRHRSDDIIKMEVGVRISAPVGTLVKCGDKVLLAHHAEPRLSDEVRALLESAIVVGDELTHSKNPIICVVK